jgi:predicted kinase
MHDNAQDNEPVDYCDCAIPRETVNEIAQLRAELSKAEADRDAYKAALEPYADWNNWQRLDSSTGAIIFLQEDGRKGGDEIARAALDKVEP